jgi:predicted anti-sigma-YlaC factor YlaD
MDCHGVRNNISSYIDGEIDDNQAILVKKHIDDCTTCTYEYQRMLKAWKTLELWHEIEPPEYMKKTILYRITHENLTLWRNISLSAAAVLLISISIFMFNGKSQRIIDRDITGKTEKPSLQVSSIIKDINEDEIILNLQLLKEKEFYDSLETLKKIDYLPLVEEPVEEQDNDRTSSLEFLLI